MFNIGNRNIGNDYPPVVVVEIGINHEGSLAVAKKMVDEAVQSGAEIIKHQTHIIEDEMSDHAKNVIPGNANTSIYEIMEKCSLNENDEFELKEYVESKGAIFISTPFSRKAAYRLKEFNVPAYKIGSGECNNYPLIELIASFKKPIILSTGMNSIDTIKPAVNIFRKEGIPFALLHCTNIYPTPYNLIRLNAIQELKSEFPDCVVGLSDHSESIYPCLGAVALGAKIIERHFTDTKDRNGPDISCSMDPKELKDLIDGSNIIHKSGGFGKGPLKEEQPTIDFAFVSVVAIKDIQSGAQLSKDNIWLKRPSGGDFGSIEFNNLIGAKAIKNIRSGEQISKNDIEFNK